MLFRTPADVGVKDFARATESSAQKLAKGWDSYQSRNVSDALKKSQNYYDPRAGVADATAPIPWNAFPRTLDRWHKVLGDPTPAKQAQAETTADTVIEYLLWWEIGEDGKPAIQAIPAHLLGLLSVEQRALARRPRLGSGAGAEFSMCYRQQDEYCEWHAEHDDQGRLTRLSFTAEPPEYWTFLAASEPDLVFELYKELVGDHVSRDDLFYPDQPVAYGVGKDGVKRWLPFAKKGAYNRYNKWNSTDGAVHLTHPANTLGAEIDLAARASLAWQSDIDGPSPAFDDDPALTRIACAGYGAINRSSDPSIGEQVGIQVSAGNRVSLTDPIGLYIARVDLSTLERETATGRVQVLETDVLTVTRGDADAIHPRKLHLKLQAPPGANWVLGDCFLDNRRIERAGQIARRITMALYADVQNGGADINPQPCRDTLVCRHAKSPGFFGTFDPTDIPTCASATENDWSQEIPYELPTALVAGRSQNLDVALDMHLKLALGAGGGDGSADTAPVGEEILAELAISTSRAALP